MLYRELGHCTSKISNYKVFAMKIYLQWLGVQKVAQSLEELLVYRKRKLLGLKSKR